MKRGREIRVGDDLIFLGTPHRITRIEPYPPTELNARLWDGKARIAYSDTAAASYKAAWGITLDPNGTYDVGGAISVVEGDQP